MQDLWGKTILITGAAGAVGQACAELFLGAGAAVAMTDRTAPPDAEGAWFQAADVTDRQAIGAVAEAVIARFGRIDAAVLAAGIEGAVGPLEEITDTQIDAALAVNLKGSLYAMQACLPNMKANRAGSIVALSSISGLVGAAQLAPYAISKHAVLGLVRTAALETGRFGVRVNAVCPGPIDSPMMHRLDAALAARDRARPPSGPGSAPGVPLQRYATAGEVAKMIAFLCSEASASCHGGAYMVDGGFTAK